MAKLSLVTLTGDLRLVQGISRELVESVSDEAIDLVRAEAEPIVQEHYDNVIRQVGLLFKGPGLPGAVEHGGVRQISFGTVGGGVRTIRTKRWEALGEQYRKGNKKKNIRRSFQFWRKNHILSGAYQLEIARHEWPIRVLEQVSKRSHHKDRINTTMDFRFPPLPFPFTAGISLPFVRRSEMGTMNYPNEAIDREGLGRARFPEQNLGKPKGHRPFLRRMAVLLGKEMHKDLAKKLR